MQQLTPADQRDNSMIYHVTLINKTEWIFSKVAIAQGLTENQYAGGEWLFLTFLFLKYLFTLLMCLYLNT